MATFTFETVTYMYFGDCTRITSFCHPWQYFIESLDYYVPWWWANCWTLSNDLSVLALELAVWYVGRCSESSQPYWWWCGNYQDSDTLQLSLLSDNDQYTTLGLCLTTSLFHDVTRHSLCTPILEPAQTHWTLQSFLYHILSAASVAFPSLTIPIAHKSRC
jgi:hypothetical protein